MTRGVSAAVVGTGLILLGVSLTADIFSLGNNPDLFGPLQLTGTGFGLVLAIVGLVLRSRGRR